MADTVVAGKLTLDGSQANKSVKSFKQELREAQVDLMQMQRQFGELSPEALTAARNVAQLRDQIQEAREVTELFDPGKKFAVFGNVLRTVAGGFSALTGAAALFGAESEDLQKTLLKVQSALAITEGVNTIVDAAKDFQRLKAIALDALKGIRAGIASTGIGLLVVALGTIVAYWDEIKEAVTGVSEEQRDLLSITTQQAEVEKEKLTHMDEQDNILKLQGKSEKEILQLKIDQLGAAISAGEVQLETQKQVQHAQLETAKRNREILDGIILFLNAPLTILLTTVDQVRKALGQDSTLAKDLNNWLASFVIDPKEMADEYKKADEELEKGLIKLRNTRAGYMLQVRDINKQEQKEREERQKEEEERLFQLTEAEREAFLARLRLRKMFNAEADKLRKERDDADKKALEAQTTAGFRQAQALMEVYAAIREENKSQQQRDYEEQLQNLQIQYESRLALVKGNEAAEAAVTEQYEKQKSQIERSEYEYRLGVIGSFFGRAAELFGQNTLAYKALAIAQATINTYLGVSDALAAKTFTIFDTVVKFVNAGLILASGLANVKRIAAVQVAGFGGGGGGAVPAGSVSAPLQVPRPQQQTTRLPQDQINQIGNATVRAFVVESDVTQSQERIRRLNRAATLGGG